MGVQVMKWVGKCHLHGQTTTSLPPSSAYLFFHLLERRKRRTHFLEFKSKWRQSSPHFKNNHPSSKLKKTKKNKTNETRRIGVGTRRGERGKEKETKREREREEDEKRERDEAIPNDSPTFNQIFYLILRGGGSFCQAPRCFNRERTFPHAQ